MYGKLLPLFVWTLACPAEQWQIGAAAGYGAYKNASIYAPAGKATAGFRNRFAVSVVLGEDAYRHVSGEFRYTYQDGDPFLAAGGMRTNLQGQSHAFHYDLLFHLRSKSAKVRPFLAFGIGAKFYAVTGPENPRQPLSQIGLLTTTDETKPLATGGGGVRLQLSRNVILRLDFRDYVTPFPKKLIAPAPFGTARGWFHQFTPLLGISYAF